MLKTQHTITIMKARARRAISSLAERIELGKHIVADPQICHGKPTFKGTRIMVWQVLDDVAEGRSWDWICKVRWGGRIPITAVSEAVRLAQKALLDTEGRLNVRPELAAA